MASAAELFTLKSFAEIGGATLAVSVTSTVARQLLKRTTPWIPFVASVIVSLVGAGAAGALQNTTGHTVNSPEFYEGIGAWLVVFLNACLMFCGALGINEVGRGITTPPPPPSGQTEAERPAPGLFDSWIRR
jgi:hypothetical protein